MAISYKNKYGSIITEQQTVNLSTYLKCYSNSNGVIEKEEKYSSGELMGLRFNNYQNENHQVIVSNNNSNNYKWISILENEIHSGFRLEKGFVYAPDGSFKRTHLALYDLQEEVIAHGTKDENGDYDYDWVRKYYFDRSVNPDKELFECTYDDNGNLLELYWNNEGIDPHGQESFALWNKPNDQQELINLTGMSQQLVDYYMVADIIPDF